MASASSIVSVVCSAVTPAASRPKVRLLFVPKYVANSQNLGFEEEAARLTLPGSDGYLDELAFVAASHLLPGRLEVLPIENRLLSYGEGLCHLQIQQTMTIVGAGRGSPHFQIGRLCLTDSEFTAASGLNLSNTGPIQVTGATASDVSSLYEGPGGGESQGALSEPVRCQQLSKSREEC